MMLKRIKDNLRRLSSAYSIYRKVDKRCGTFLIKLFVKEKLRMVGKQDYENKHALIKYFLIKKFAKYLKYLHQEEQIKIIDGSNNTIWIYWDNLNSIPKIVRCCISSIKKNNPDKEVVIVDEKNIANYIEIEEHVWNKYKKGCITKTHFSDIVRISLLLKYGGIYMDATILQVGQMPSDITHSQFFTMRLQINQSWKVVSQGNWCVFFIACSKGNLLMKATLDMMNEYWRDESLLIDYLLIDYLWSIAADNNNSIRKMLDDVPFTNPELFNLSPSLVCSDSDFNNYVNNKDTQFYKLSYKSTIGVPEYRNGKFTVLEHIINRYL